VATCRLSGMWEAMNRKGELMMKILVATATGGLDDEVAASFGRAPVFTIVEVLEQEILNATVSPNEFSDAAEGAGIQAAQWTLNSGAQVVIAGNFGPKASDVFSRSKVKAFRASGMTVGDAVQRYLTGKLTVHDHDAAGATSPGPGDRVGRGRGMGRGQGMRQGRGGGMGRRQGGRQ